MRLSKTRVREELKCLDTLMPFSEKSEYSPLLFVAPLGFGVDNGHPETKILKEKYTSLRKKINETYGQSNPFEVMLEMLGLRDKSVTLPRGTV
jgi:hypothetical protein